jgi:hypothetical protein
LFCQRFEEFLHQSELAALWAQAMAFLQAEVTSGAKATGLLEPSVARLKPRPFKTSLTQPVPGWSMSRF